MLIHIPNNAINNLQRKSIHSLKEMAAVGSRVDIIVHVDGKQFYFEGDWMKAMRIAKDDPEVVSEISRKQAKYPNLGSKVGSAVNFTDGSPESRLPQTVPLSEIVPIWDDKLKAYIIRFCGNVVAQGNSPEAALWHAKSRGFK